ncbi:MAG: pyruvate dehydrogenase complex dihydrolipoamide acetyltransferase [Pseudomonadota bacterium]|nr:pyruvate dehydrogenase complex dihydrolipoamide acetyltransferase [Pseudomonadota bacterium]
MPVKILMPALSPTMTDGKLAKWNVSIGDDVASGDVLAEIETDKATMEVEAVEEGRVAKLLVQEGSENVAVNSVIALLLEDGETADEIELTEDFVSENKIEIPIAEREREATPLKANHTPPEHKGLGEGADPVDKDRVLASPLAKRMASQAGIGLDEISGSGPNGRIVKRDIEAVLSGGLPAVVAANPTSDTNNQEYELIEHSTMRKTIAARLTESKQTVPHFYVRVDCEIDKLLEFRAELNKKADGAYKLSINDIIIKAAGVALKKVPNANSCWTESGIRVFRSADISVAVSVEGGLITPIIFNADGKGLEQISKEMHELAERARDGKLSPEEYTGGTFSISNLGMYGVKSFDAVINPPQACILAVGAGQQSPVVHNGALAVATVMNLTLSADHRAVDGAVAAEYMKCLSGLIEDPMTMLL